VVKVWVWETAVAVGTAVGTAVVLLGVARANYWPGVTFWELMETLKEPFSVESSEQKLLVLVRLTTCFASRVFELFTTSLRIQFFCSCSASIVSVESGSF
jgi:hypothetical protein